MDTIAHRYVLANLSIAAITLAATGFATADGTKRTEPPAGNHADSGYSTSECALHDLRIIYHPSPGPSGQGGAAAAPLEADPLRGRRPFSPDSLLQELPDVGVITKVPEFHDCQRFIVQDRRRPRAPRPSGALVGMSYDSVYAIWGVLRLPKVWTSLQALDVRRSAAVRLLKDSANAIRSMGMQQWRATRDSIVDASKHRALLVAVIYTWGGRYDRLGIRNGFNCVYLHTPATPGAKVLPLGTDRADCPDTIRADRSPRGVKDLSVRRRTISGLSAADYPRVARWEWDDRQLQQFIGIMCDAWCWIGPSGFAPAPSYPNVLPSGSAEQRRVTEAWGWFDEQYLAIPEAPGSRKLIPSRTRGTLFPDPALDRYTQADFDSTWRVAARVSLSHPELSYESNYNFLTAPTASPMDMRGVTTIELCKGSGCEGVPPTLGNICAWPAPESKPAPDERWWARITSSGKVVYKCVIRRDHSDLVDEEGAPIRVPGTARWHWTMGDEPTWKRCDNGCCEVIQ